MGRWLWLRMDYVMIVPVLDRLGGLVEWQWSSCDGAKFLSGFLKQSKPIKKMASFLRLFVGSL
jgi:hypothetical protein